MSVFPLHHHLPQCSIKCMLKEWKSILFVSLTNLSSGFIGFFEGHNLIQGIVVNSSGFRVR